MRKLALASLLVLSLGACSAGVVITEPGPGVTTEAATQPASIEVPITEAPASTEATLPAANEPSAAPAIPEDAVDAPDFSLLLGDGTTYTLSEDTKPVYLVFWAEW